MSLLTAPTPDRIVNRRFVRHYVEMVAVMFAGMGVLMLPSAWAMGAVGTSWAELRADAPAAMLLWMAVIMVVPMAGWMAFRGHSARANLEMAASMVLPTLAIVAAMGAGLVGDVGSALVLEHVLMLAGMLVAMLARPEEYSHHAH